LALRTPSIKAPNHPLHSTFLHQNHILKISVRFNLLTKPHQMVFISLLSLFWEGIKPSSWIHIAKPGYPDVRISGILG
jgi:hypothetical protein